METGDFWFELPFSKAYLERLAGETGGDGDGSTKERAWVERLGKRLGGGLGETEKSVLLMIRSNGRISTRVLAEEIGVSTTAMDKTLAKLKGQGVLRRVGPARGGHWEIRGDDDE